MCIDTNYSARIEVDSVSPDGVRLTTFVVRYPLCIHSEMLTHRMFSRNSSSSRAIPVSKQIEAVELDPFISVPTQNKKGMQAGDLLSLDSQKEFLGDLLCLKRSIVDFAKTWKNDVHKQWLNRYLEPFSWITTIITATEYKNFFSLRCSRESQPEICKIATMMRDLYNSSQPKKVEFDQWHLPFVVPEEKYFYDIEQLIKLSVARCARVSYLNHDGLRDTKKDLALHDKLLSSKRMSPFEHQLTPYREYSVFKDLLDSLKRNKLPSFAAESSLFIGNTKGWVSYRKTLPNESGA